MEGCYRQTIPGFDIAIEKGTSNVPKDRRYHIVVKSKVIYSTKVLRLAQLKFGALLKKMGHSLDRIEEKPTAEDVKEMLNKQRIDQFYKLYDDFWDNSYKFRKGGRLNKR